VNEKLKMNKLLKAFLITALLGNFKYYIALQATKLGFNLGLKNLIV